MPTEAAALRAPRAPTLTGRASLNAVQSLLDYGAKLGVGLVVTPIVVTGLGRSLFGVWEMLNRLVTYMSAADRRPTEARRLIVSSRQAVDDDALQRRAVGPALLIWVLARRYVHWFGVARPARADVMPLLSMSAWLTVGEAVAKLLLACDVIILGWVVSPALVTTYVLTGYAARTAIGIHVFAAGAAMPGLGGLIGRGERERARAVRRELLTLTWLFATTVGVTILCWNLSFLALWVGQQHYGGPWLDLLIILTAVQTVFIRTDAYVIDAALQPRPRVLPGGGRRLVTIALAVPLTRLFGAVGLCICPPGGRP